MYKLTRLDGTDFFSGKINYADNIGKIVRVKDFDPPEKGPCGKGFHASRNPNDCFIGSEIPCRAFRVKGIQKISGNEWKSRYQALKIIEEIQDLNSLFGWNYEEAINPVNPFLIEPPTIQEKHLISLKNWISVRKSVWTSVRGLVLESVWDSVCDSDRDSAVDSIWDATWDATWAYIGSFFPNIKRWEYIKHEKGVYPFQPAVDLWKQGIVPSFDGKVWRLHTGEEAKIVWEGE